MNATEATPGLLRAWTARATLVGDAMAGVSVALLAIPQSLAYARVAGVPAYVGLYAAALPPIVAAFFASSPYLQPGPAAVPAVMTAGALAGLAAPGSPEYVALAALLALLVGVIRLGIGVLEMGRVVWLMSEPVLRGFTTGAVLLIAFSQLPLLVGVDTRGMTPLHAAGAAFTQFPSWELETLAIATVTFLTIVIARRLHPLIPWAVIVTVGGVAYSKLTGYTGGVVGAIPSGFIPFSLDFPWTALPRLLVPGVVIALVGFAEAATIARIFAAKDRQRWEPDRDFVSQGMANVAAAVSGGFPVGGSFSRSTLGRMLGARTQRSGAITGLTVLLFLPFAFVLGPLPNAVLGAVVITAVMGLVRVRPILEMWPLSRAQFMVAGGTLVLTLLLAPRIDQAVILGILTSIGVHLWREFKLKVVHWTEDDALHVRPEGVLWFGSAEMLRQDVLALVAEHRGARRLILDMERVGRVDLTASLALKALVNQTRAAGLETEVRSVHPITARALQRVLAQQAKPSGRDADPSE
jgi:SulP family sulfate permease